MKKYPLNNILKCVANYYELSITEITGASRKGRCLVEARQMYCFIARSNNYVFEEIGKEINRDHATAMHGVNKIKYYLEIYEETREAYIQITKALKSNSIESIVIKNVDLLRYCQIYNQITIN